MVYEFPSPYGDMVLKFDRYKYVCDHIKVSFRPLTGIWF